MKKNIKYNCKDCGVEVETRVIGEGNAYWKRKCPYCYSQSLIAKTAPEKPKSATFTQGEWKNRSAVTNTYYYIETPTREVAKIHQYPIYPDLEALANAQLIASAPEMLKALKQASEYCDLREIGEGGLSVQEIVDNAIAKAEGVQS